MCINSKMTTTSPKTNIESNRITFFEWSPPPDILSGMYSDIPSGILFGLPCGILFEFYLTYILPYICKHIFWHSIWHIPWHMFYHFVWYLIFDLPNIWHSVWQLRSSGAHCARSLADEVQRCTLQSGAGESIGEKVGEEDRRGGEGGGGRAALIKSSNPHLAGGE